MKPNNETLLHPSLLRQEELMKKHLPIPIQVSFKLYGVIERDIGHAKTSAEH